MQTNIPVCSTCSQKNCVIAKFCTPKWKTVLGERKSFGVYGKKQLIIAEGNTVHGIYFIYSGKIKVFNNGKSGKENIVRLAGPGEMLGLRGMAEKNYRVNISTIENSLLCFIEKSIFFSALKQNHKMALNLILYYAQELSNVENRQKLYYQSGVEERLARALLMLLNKFGVHRADGSVLLDIAITKQELSDIAGAAYESALRALSLLKKKENTFRLEAGKFVITNVKRLQQIAGKE